MKREKERKEGQKKRLRGLWGDRFLTVRLTCLTDRFLN